MENKNEEISKRLRAALAQKFGGLTDAAKALNMLPQSLNPYWTGRSKPGNKLLDRLDKAGIDINWILTGTHKEIEESLTSLSDTVTDYNSYVFLLAQKYKELEKENELLKQGTNYVGLKGGRWYKVIYSIDAGDPVQIFREENYTGEEVYFPFGNEETCFPLKVVGDSMTCATGDSIPDGEYVLADLSETPLPGDVVVISLSAGRQMIKQYIEGPEDSITLRSFNSDYPDIIVRKVDVVKMIRVIGQGHFKRR